MVIKCAFGQLKARFAALIRPMDINLNDLPDAICAGFVLHNYCEASKEIMDEHSVMSALYSNMTRSYSLTHRATIS